MRPLSNEEKALWGKVISTVRRRPSDRPSDRLSDTIVSQSILPRIDLRAPVVNPVKPAPAPARKEHKGGLKPANTLDHNWDKRIAKGAIEPDVTIDLHGETLATAHAHLNRGLAAAIRQGARVILLVTGKEGVGNPRLAPTGRGVIRASVKDWLGLSSYASRIAAIRGAHPRHGGAGALYIILRRAP